MPLPDEGSIGPEKPEKLASKVHNGLPTDTLSFQALCRQSVFEFRRCAVKIIVAPSELRHERSNAAY